MRDGTVILIKDMESSHILNSIKFFENSGLREKELKWLREELDKRQGKKPDEPVESRYHILDLRKKDE